jgi:hypothetical protein
VKLASDPAHEQRFTVGADAGRDAFDRVRSDLAAGQADAATAAAERRQRSDEARAATAIAALRRRDDGAEQRAREAIGARRRR